MSWHSFWVKGSRGRLLSKGLCSPIGLLEAPCDGSEEQGQEGAGWPQSEEVPLTPPPLQREFLPLSPYSSPGH